MLLWYSAGEQRDCGVKVACFKPIRIKTVGEFHPFAFFFFSPRVLCLVIIILVLRLESPSRLELL